VVNAKTQPLYHLEKNPAPIVQEAGWALGLVWAGMKILPPPPDFESWTIQPIQSHYTDYTNVALFSWKENYIYIRTLSLIE
jgi:hypothetical protein